MMEVTRKTFALMKYVVSVVLFVALVPSLASSGGTAEPGAEALAPFKQALMQALKTGMARGPVHALEACNTKAPGIADQASQDGVRVGRASHKLRNPANVAPTWVQPILDDYLENEETRAPRTVQLDEGRSGYVEPIGMQPLCLTCHGSAIAPDVASQIAVLYPDDQATGFEAGDLRGVFWVELPASHSTPETDSDAGVRPPS